MASIDERTQRYAEAIAVGQAKANLMGEHPSAEVVAVADAEQAELRAEAVARLELASQQMRRAEAAEAKVARVEALCESADLRFDEPRLWTSEIRAALDGKVAP